MTSQPLVSRFDRLCSYLRADPDNERLLADAAAAGLDEHRAAEARDLLDRRAAAAPLSAELENLRGLAALHAGDGEAAAATLEPLAAAGEGGATVRFNLAVAKSRTGDFAGVVALIDEELLAEQAAAALLKVRALHHLGQVEEALAVGKRAIDRGHADPELMAALASLALDAEDPALAAKYADRAGNAPEGLAAKGTVLLSEGRLADALPVLRRAVAAGPDNARAAAALGSALLAAGDTSAAAGELDRAAEGFGNHPGSWIAAGWARLVAGDVAAARTRFEAALACDDSFAESHGALGVADVMEGKTEDARRRLDVAARLDRNCFSAALGRMLLLESEGAHAAAERVKRTALATPVGPGGQTMAEAIAALAAGRRR
jgi:tetratricopeptide (TPR) repeat protein